MSNFVEGQGILGKIRFVDGELPEYNRTYLIINVTSEYIEVLNVSSIRGKERKLAFSTNERLRSFKPPFLKPSFVKLKRSRNSTPFLSSKTSPFYYHFYY